MLGNVIIVINSIDLCIEMNNMIICLHDKKAFLKIFKYLNKIGMNCSFSV